MSKRNGIQDNLTSNLPIKSGHDTQLSKFLICIAATHKLKCNSINPIHITKTKHPRM